MNNDEAMAILVAKRQSLTKAIDGLDRYRKESASWKAANKTAQKTAIKADAIAAGADLSAWTGNPAPVVEVV